MARTPVTDDEIEEAAEKVKEVSEMIEEEFGGDGDVSDAWRELLKGDAPHSDRLKEILNEIQRVIEREPDKYRKMLKSGDYDLKTLFESREVIVMRHAADEINRLMDDFGVPDDDQFEMREALYRAYTSAAPRMCDELSGDAFSYLIVFQKPNEDW